jgi:nitroimidazol reductase NimA-like FMN-containing flavoprotein (pyridoxamine 5'-phosphate oxidase superfamily)
MPGDATLEARATAVIDANKYMTLATVDETGRPWATPVYYTPDRYTDFYWVSAPGARHSANPARSPGISIVIFDSQVAIGHAEAVYLAAHAREVPEEELARCSELFSGRFPELREFGPEQLRPPAPLRLYRATVTEHSVLIRGADPAYGSGVDSRATVSLG